MSLTEESESFFLPHRQHVGEEVELDVVGVVVDEHGEREEQDGADYVELKRSGEEAEGSSEYHVCFHFSGTFFNNASPALYLRFVFFAFKYNVGHAFSQLSMDGFDI